MSEKIGLKQNKKLKTVVLVVITGVYIYIPLLPSGSLVVLKTILVWKQLFKCVGLVCIFTHKKDSGMHQDHCVK